MSVADLLGQGSRQRPSYYRFRDPEDGTLVHVFPVSLAGHLQLSMPKSLAHELAAALDVEMKAND